MPGAPAADPVRARAEAGRHARSRLRRYCVANGLNRLGTLTYKHGCHDVRQVRADVGVFFRALRSGLNGRPLPYAWVPEWHKSHGLHLHFALGRYVRRGLIESAWHEVPDADWVNIKLLGDLSVGSGRVGEARKAAGYLGKYVAKDFDVDNPVPGLHLYDLAQGFQPQVQRISGRSADAVVDAACRVMGSEPSWCWSSREVEDWKGAPAISVRWT